MAKKEQKEMKGIGKYRFIYMGLAAVLLVVFGLITALNKAFAELIILYTTAGILIVFGVVRFIPLMKYLHDKRRLIMNAIEIFANIVIGIIMIYIAMQEGEGWLLNLYCYLLSLVLFARGVIFMVEGIYCEGEKEVIKFIVHLAFIVCATVVVTLNLDLTNLRWLLVAVAALIGGYCVVDSYKSFNRYRRLYVNVEKEREYEERKENTKQTPVPQAEEREEVYVN